MSSSPYSATLLKSNSSVAAFNSDKIGKKLILPVKCIKGHKYAIYIETEYDTSNFWITMGGISAEQANLYPLNDCNGRNGYMWEFTTSSWNGEFKLNEGGTSPTGSCHVYMYDLTQDVTMALDKVGKLELKQLHFMYKPIFYCEKNLNVNDITGLSKTFSFLIQNLKQNYGELGLNGDQNSRTYYFTNYKSFSNEKKYIIQCFLDKNDSTANALTIEVQYANMPWESVGSNSPDDMIAINLTQLPGYIFEITPKSVEEKGELVGIRVSINLNRYQDDDNEREQAKQPFKFILSMFEVCDSLDDLLMKQPIINRIAQSLNISDSYDMELVETYKITTLNPADLYDRHPFNFGFNKDKDRLKMYIAKIKSNNGVPHGVTNVRAIYRYQNENGIYENISRGVSSVINAYIESGQYVFEAVQSIQNNMQDQSPNYIEVALSNTSWRTTSADITVEIYEIRVKSSIYDGLVNVTYPINKNLPVGLTRLDLTSESITVNKDHTLSGIPAENVDFKYTFDNGKVFTCKAEVDYQGAGSMAYKKKNLNEKDILRIADLVCQLQVK